MPLFCFLRLFFKKKRTFFKRFVNNRLQELNSDYQESKSAYEEQQNAVVKEIITIASGYSEPLHILGELIAKLDVLVSFAQVMRYEDEKACVVFYLTVLLLFCFGSKARVRFSDRSNLKLILCSPQNFRLPKRIKC